MIKPIAVALMLLPLSAFAEDDVKLLEAGQESACKLVKQDVCKSTSMDPQKDCMEWHQEHAGKAKADAMVMRGSEESRRTRPSLSGNKMVTTTAITADYYQCGFKEKREKAMRAVNKAEYGVDHFEKRLKNLEKLKKKGLITEEEYQAQRKEIISDI